MPYLTKENHTMTQYIYYNRIRRGPTGKKAKRVNTENGNPEHACTQEQNKKGRKSIGENAVWKE